MQRIPVLLIEAFFLFYRIDATHGFVSPDRRRLVAVGDAPEGKPACKHVPGANGSKLRGVRQGARTLRGCLPPTHSSQVDNPEALQ